MGGIGVQTAGLHLLFGFQGGLPLPREREETVKNVQLCCTKVKFSSFSTCTVSFSILETLDICWKMTVHLHNVLYCT